MLARDLFGNTWLFLSGITRFLPSVLCSNVLFLLSLLIDTWNMDFGAIVRNQVIDLYIYYIYYYYYYCLLFVQCSMFQRFDENEKVNVSEL